LKSTGLESGAGLWETVGMAKIYIPKVNDVVLMNGQDNVRYVVIKVDGEAKRADVHMVSSAKTIHRNVPWPDLYELDESQNAARIVREATEE
jgi:hypothetical protein